MSDSEACALATMEWKNGVPVNLEPRKRKRNAAQTKAVSGRGEEIARQRASACVRAIDGGFDGDTAAQPRGDRERCGRRVGAEEHDADVAPERQPGPQREFLPLGRAAIGRAERGREDGDPRRGGAAKSRDSAVGDAAFAGARSGGGMVERGGGEEDEGEDGDDASCSPRRGSMANDAAAARERRTAVGVRREKHLGARRRRPAVRRTEEH